MEPCGIKDWHDKGELREFQVLTSGEQLVISPLFCALAWTKLCSLLGQGHAGPIHVFQFLIRICRKAN